MNNNSSTNISSTSPNAEDVSYNKRQFWEYKRLYGGSTSKSKIKSKINKLSPSQNKTQTRKVFHLVNNKIATDKHLVKRLTSIYIPPAYKDIVVAKSANNKIQAIGTDNRGRRQYVYNNNLHIHLKKIFYL